MDVKTINRLLAEGDVDREEMWPRVVEMESQAAQFRFEFGLDEIPTEPGLITIRGPRQYGKSTWLDLNLRGSVQDFGKGSAFYLNGDELSSSEELAQEMKALAGAYHPQAKVRRLFIDEITAVPEWERAVKKVIDQGLFRDVLIVTTGSKANDLRRGTERLPGRKGKLKQSEYIFLPISYREFRQVAGKEFGDKTWMAYLLSGGSPIACNHIFQFKRIPEYFLQLTKDWIFGEIVASGRSRLALTQLLHVLMRFGGNPVGYAKVAREAGLANNTVASGYIEQLSDLLSVLPSWSWDHQKKVFLLRKPCKFHFINLGVVTALHPAGLRHVHEYEALPRESQAMLLEWLVAQEIWRRAVLAKSANPEAIGFWQSKEHEIDFVTPEEELIEVKRGKAGPLDFGWFAQVFPKEQLSVICETPFQTKHIRGMTIEEFLLNAPTTLYYEEM
ncbi:MAG: ATP-binding protein [Deltaproteobacteria bacterium]|nr:ATP-binding protein [Deltaproteobacteria bacterium]